MVDNVPNNVCMKLSCSPPDFIYLVCVVRSKTDRSYGHSFFVGEGSYMSILLSIIIVLIYIPSKYANVPPLHRHYHLLAFVF